MTEKELEIIRSIKSIPSKYKSTRDAERVIKAIESSMGYNHYSHEDSYKVKMIIEGMTQKGYMELIKGTSIFRIKF